MYKEQVDAYLIRDILWDYRYFVDNTRVGVLLKERNYLTNNNRSVTVYVCVMNQEDVYDSDDTCSAVIPLSKAP